MTRQELKNILENIDSEDDIVDLVCSRWGFEFQDTEIPTDEIIEEKTVVQSMKIIAKAPDNSYNVLLIKISHQIQSKNQKITASKIIRNAYKKLPESIKNSLIIISSDDFKSLLFSQVRSFDKSLRIRKFIINLPKTYWTPLEQLSKLDLNASKESPFDLLENCFDVDAVSEEFFNIYQTIFNKFKTELEAQIKDESLAHDFVQQLFGRILFIYFLQKKSWLNNDQSFFKHFWENYLENKNTNSDFYNDYLKILFFNALKQGKGVFISPNEAPNMPKELRESLQMFPYLNGGLFDDNNKLDNLEVKITDDLFKELIEELLENFNFTIDEESPLDVELAIDPSMLGLVYESVINSKERGKDGIFYTDKVELDMMCRLSLTRYLIKNTDINKTKLYQWIFHEEDEEDEEIKVEFSSEEIENLNRIVRDIKIVDPACGSGGYLVTFLNILFELITDLTKRKGNNPESYRLKKQIIENSLYGVDVKYWAIEIARLRLWLNLVIDADDDLAQEISQEPLLPSLDFKIREGDSLVQKIGDEYIVPEEKQKFIKQPEIKRKITELINRKQAFYFGREYQNKKQTRMDIELHETQIFRLLLETQKKLLADEYKKTAVQTNMFGESRIIQQNFEDKIKEENKKKIEDIDKVLSNLKKFATEKAFWPISFAEVFDREEKGGFDVVIANPPYVRQESITPPNLPNPTLEQKNKYKAELNHVAELWFPDWFNKKKLSGRSDLYVFFYLLGLKLLNERGVFCYISENSWLDVGYGANLQEFLLHNVPMQMIIDNQVKRSFKSASVNTIVVIFDAPVKKAMLLNNLVKFINFKKEFESINNSNNFLEIESKDYPSPNRPEQSNKFRIFNLTQEKLFDNGLEKQKDEMGLKVTGSYIGDKWGGKYLRAPDIYWTILEKGKDKLVRLGDIADVRFGIKTGANEFFYLEDVTDKVGEG